MPKARFLVVRVLRSFNLADLTTDSGDWNEELIRDIFFPVDANAILKLPMISRGEGFWAWEQEKHGNYSVKSAYRLQEYV